MPNSKTTRTPSGAGSIRQRPDGRWEARLTLGYDEGTGKRKTLSIYGATQKEVKKSSVRRRLDAQLDILDDRELSVIEATVNGLCKAKEPEE